MCALLEDAAEGWAATQVLLALQNKLLRQRLPTSRLEAP